MLNKLIIFFFILGVVLVVFLLKNQVSVSSCDYSKASLQRFENALNTNTTTPIKVGITYTADKAFEVKNQDFKHGITLATNIINQNGLLNGRKIELVYKEYPDDVEEAKKVSREFAENPEIVASISNSNSNIIMGISIDYEFSTLPFIATSATDPLLTKETFKYIFRNIPDDILMAKELAKLADNLQYENIVVLHSKSKYGMLLSSVFIEKGTEFGMNILYRASFSESDRMFKKVVSKISPFENKEIDYDAIFLVGDFTSVSNLIIQLRESGIYAPIITTNILDTPEFLKLGKIANSVIVPTYFSLDILNFTTQEFIKLYQKEYNKLPNADAVEGYDAMMLLAQAITNAKSSVPSDISESLKFMDDFQSISGDYSLNTKGDVVDKKIFFKKVINEDFKFLHLK